MSIHINKNSSDCVDQLKILADDNRLKIIKTLMLGPQNVSDLVHSLGADQSLISHHLKVLRDANLVSSTRHGKSIIYTVSEKIRTKQSTQSIDLGCCKLNF